MEKISTSNAASRSRTSFWVRINTNWYRNPWRLSEINLFCWCIYFIWRICKLNWIWYSVLVHCFSYGAVVAFDFESNVIERSTMLEFLCFHVFHIVELSMTKWYIMERNKNKTTKPCQLVEFSYRSGQML